MRCPHCVFAVEASAASNLIANVSAAQLTVHKAILLQKRINNWLTVCFGFGGFLVFVFFVSFLH